MSAGVSIMDRPEPETSAGGALVPAPQVRLSAERTRVVIPHQGHLAEPVIELVREGDVVRAIDITCCCGQRYRLLCEYGTAGQR
jgi:hypothetical protein